MKNTYLIVGLFVVAAIGFYFWYEQKNKQSNPNVLASPQGTNTVTPVFLGGGSGGAVAEQPSPNFAGALLTGLGDMVKGLITGNQTPVSTMPVASGTTTNPISNVIQNEPFKAPIAAPVDKSSMPVVNPIDIHPPLDSHLGSNIPDAPAPLPKTDFSSPIGPAKFRNAQPLLPIDDNRIVINPVSGFLAKSVVTPNLNIAPPLKVTNPATVNDTKQLFINNIPLAKTLFGGHYERNESLFESL